MHNKPTKALIEARARYVGGSLTELPYTATSGAVLTAIGSGWWGPLYQYIAREILYHTLKYDSEVLGDTNSPAFPADWTLIVPNTAQAKPQQVIDQLFMGDPLITVKSPSKAKEARDREKKAAKYLMGRLQQEERESDISPLQEQMSLTLLYGLAARMVLLDVEHRWPEKPEPPLMKNGRRNIASRTYREAVDKYDAKRRGRAPFITRTLPPLAIAYDRVNNPPQWCMIREPILPSEAMELYPHLDFPDRPETEATVALAWTRYWTPEYYACYVDGQAGLTGGDGADEDGIAENPYGLIPVWPSGGAFGEMDVAGRPEVELAGIMRANLDSFRAEASLTNTLMIHARRAGFGPKVIISGVDDDQEREQLERQIMQGPERVIFLPPNASVDNLNPSELPKSVLEMRAETVADIDRGVTYDVAAGDPNPAQSGVSRQIVQQQVGKRVKVTALHVQQTIEAWGMAELSMIKNVLKESVTSVYGSEEVELGPEDIDDGMTVNGDLLTDSVLEKARKIAEGMTLIDPKNPIISMETFYRDYMQLDDPQAEKKAKLKDDIFRMVIQPMVLQVAQGQAQALIGGAAEAAGISMGGEGQAVGAVSAGAQGAELRVGTDGAMLPGEAHNPANDAEMTPERMDLEQRQMQAVGTNGTRAIPRIRGR